MEKFKLNNGATIVIAECSSKELSVSVTVNVGHVNEPKLGIAALYENVLMKQVSRVQTVYGGTVTSFFTGCEKEELEMTMSKMANLIKAPHLGSDLIQAAAFDIVEHTRDLAPLVKRQMKLLYKHTAFGKKRVLWDAESYINAIESYGAPDLKEFADKYYTGKNLVVVVAGGHVGKDEVKTLAEKYFGDIPAGERQRVQLARAVRNRTTGGRKLSSDSAGMGRNRNQRFFQRQRNDVDALKTSGTFVQRSVRSGKEREDSSADGCAD